MTSQLRIAVLLSMLVGLVFTAHIATAQPTPPGSGVTIDLARDPVDPAEAKAKAERERRYRQASSNLNRAFDTIKQQYEERHASDPSAPTFEQAMQGALQRRYQGLISEVVSAVGTRREEIDNFREALQDAAAGPSMSARGNSEQEQFVSSVGGLVFTGGFLINDATRIVGELMADVARDLSLQVDPPRPDGGDNPTRRLIESSRELFNYHTGTERREITQAETRFKQQIPEITEKARQEGVFRDDRTTAPMTFGQPPNMMSIDPTPGDPTLSTMQQIPRNQFGEELYVSQRQGRPGHGFSEVQRDAGLAFLRMNFSGQELQDNIRRFNREVDRINDVERRRESARLRCLGSGGGSGGSKRAGGGRKLMFCENVELTVWDDFLDVGGSLSVAELLDIYLGYDPYNSDAMTRGRSGTSLSSAGTSDSAAGRSLSSAGNSPSSVGWSPSSAGNSPSSVGWSLSSAGNSLSSVGWSLLLDWGGGISLAGSPTMSLAGGPWNLPPPFNTAVTNEFGWNGLYQNSGNRPYALIRDPFGTLGEFSDEAYLVGYTSGLTRDEMLRVLRTSGIAGLDRLLRQPFNVVLTWGAGAFDVDLHMTGPAGTNDGTRFHIFYASRGALDSFPFVELIRDCICNSGSEVILMAQLLQGGVYRISAFNFGNQSTTSTELSTSAELEMLIVRGGVARSVGNGTTIDGGTVVFRGTPTPGQPGNTWVGVEIDPRTGEIRFVDRSDNSGNGDGPGANAAQANQAAARAAGRLAAAPTGAQGLKREPDAR